MIALLMCWKWEIKASATKMFKKKFFQWLQMNSLPGLQRVFMFHTAYQQTEFSGNWSNKTNTARIIAGWPDWASFFPFGLWPFFENYWSGLFYGYFVLGKSYAYIFTKIGFVTFWAIVSQTHPVTLSWFLIMTKKFDVKTFFNSF
jgi:hypothetical protein